jgi:hypothetical protein
VVVSFIGGGSQSTWRKFVSDLQQVGGFLWVFQFPPPHTFVTDISASTGRNDFIFDLWLWHGDLYRVSPFQVNHVTYK